MNIEDNTPEVGENIVQIKLGPTGKFEVSRPMVVSCNWKLPVIKGKSDVYDCNFRLANGEFLMVNSRYNVKYLFPCMPNEIKCPAYLVSQNYVYILCRVSDIEQARKQLLEVYKNWIKLVKKELLGGIESCERILNNLSII